MGSTRALVVRVGQRRCALLLCDVSEVMRPLPIEPLPGAPDFVPGLCIIRGAPVPVVELATLLDGEREQPGRFVTIKAGARSVALAVGAVVGVHDLESDQLSSLPPLLQHVQGIEALGAADNQLLVVLRAARLVPDELWQTLLPEEAVR